MNDNIDLDPAVRETVERAKRKARRLENGDSDDVRAIGSTVADLCYLIAYQIEAEPPTKRTCQLSQEKLEKKITGEVDNKIENYSKGINWPTATTVMTILILIAGFLWRILQYFE